MLEGDFPLHAITQRPMAMYHSWGSQNSWLRQIQGSNRLYMNRTRAAQYGIADDDWVWITSAIGRVKAQVKLMEGVNADTVWTWNAIGKRAGAWGLDTDAPEATRGFLLNHLISELLPEQRGGYRFSNSDPVTGQAAWYDLKVRVEKAAPEEAGETWPRFEAIVDVGVGSSSPSPRLRGEGRRHASTPAQVSASHESSAPHESAAPHPNPLSVKNGERESGGARG
jgi:hypothetical protein